SFSCPFGDPALLCRRGRGEWANRRVVVADSPFFENSRRGNPERRGRRRSFIARGDRSAAQREQSPTTRRGKKRRETCRPRAFCLQTRTRKGDPTHEGQDRPACRRFGCPRRLFAVTCVSAGGIGA